MSDRPLAVAIVALCAALPSTGCTLLGFGIGYASDKNHRRKLSTEQLTTLRPGAAVELQLQDGTQLPCLYREFELTPPADYADRYERTRRMFAFRMPLPRLGAGARLAIESGNVLTGELDGVGPGFLSFAEEGGHRPRAIPLTQVNSVTDAEGVSLTRRRLESLVKQRRVPLVGTLQVTTSDGASRAIPYERVLSLSVSDPRTRGRVVGTVVGLLVDAALVVSFIESWNQPWRGGSRTTSCPLVDSFDGTDWVLDAEPLGGAFYAGAERTDLVRLDRLVASRGEYRLRLRNTQEEIDHIDALALRVVEHQATTEIVPDAKGRLHAIRDVLTPTSARVVGVGGCDRPDLPVAGLLATSDGERWVSRFYGCDLDDPRQLRDGVEIEFQPIAGEGRPVLLVRAGATALASDTLAAALALQGRELPDFYERLDRDAGARERFERARKREALPNVRVWVGGWRDAGFISDLPSLVHRDQALPLDVPAEAARQGLRLRIDGPPGFWALDRAVLGFEGDGEVEERRIALSEAVLNDGTDVSDILRRADENRLHLRPDRDQVTLRFAAPRERGGRRRTVLLEATGYYSVIVRAEGDPRTEVFARLVNEPGAVARFALERLRRRTDHAAPPPAPTRATPARQPTNP